MTRGGRIGTPSARTARGRSCPSPDHALLPITLYDALHNAFWLQMLRTFDKAHATFRDALMHGNTGFQMHPATPRRSYHTARSTEHDARAIAALDGAQGRGVDEDLSDRMMTSMMIQICARQCLLWRASAVISADLASAGLG